MSKMNSLDRLTISRSDCGLKSILEDKCIETLFIQTINDDSTIVYLRRTERELEDFSVIFKQYELVSSIIDIKVSNNEIYANGSLVVKGLSLEGLRNNKCIIPRVSKVFFDDYDLDNQDIINLNKNGEFMGFNIPNFGLTERIQTGLLSEIIGLLNPLDSIHFYKRYYIEHKHNGIHQNVVTLSNGGKYSNIQLSINSGLDIHNVAIVCNINAYAPNQ